MKPTTVATVASGCSSISQWPASGMTASCTSDAAKRMTAAMVEVDHAWAHLEAIKAAGWKVPHDHPDLVPAAEAGQLTDNLRFASEDTQAQKMGEDR